MKVKIPETTDFYIYKALMQSSNPASAVFERAGEPRIKFMFYLLFNNLLMSTLPHFLLILLLLACARSQNNTAQELISAHPELLVVLDNYFGCGKWDSQTCLECSQGYYFNAKGICC
jgi:hypothetical protein